MLQGTVSLADRADYAKRTADYAQHRAGSAQRWADELCARSAQLVAESRSIRANRAGAEVARPSQPGGSVVAEPGGAGTGTAFYVEGLVDGTPVTACLNLDGKGLTCDPLLRSHAELLVALGETFPTSKDGRGLTASLEGSPAQVLVTLMRAMEVTKLWYRCDGLEIEGEFKPGQHRPGPPLEL